MDKYNKRYKNKYYDNEILLLMAVHLHNFISIRRYFGISLIENDTNRILQELLRKHEKTLQRHKPQKP